MTAFGRPIAAVQPTDAPRTAARGAVVVPSARRFALVLFAGASLMAGLFGALVLLGVTGPTPAARLAGSHGLLMTFGFLGTLIALERAVALARPWGFAAPLACGLAGVGLIAGAPAAIVHGPAVRGVDRLPRHVPGVPGHGPRAPHLGPGGRRRRLGARRGPPPGRTPGVGRGPCPGCAADPDRRRRAPRAGPDGTPDPDPTPSVRGRRHRVRRGRAPRHVVARRGTPPRGRRAARARGVARPLRHRPPDRPHPRRDPVHRPVPAGGLRLAGRRGRDLARLSGPPRPHSPATRCSTPCSWASSSPWSTDMPR